MRQFLLFLSLLCSFIAPAQNTVLKIGTSGYVTIDGQNYNRGQVHTVYQISKGDTVLQLRSDQVGLINRATKSHYLDGDNSNTPFTSMAALQNWNDSNLELSGPTGDSSVYPTQYQLDTAKIRLSAGGGGSLAIGDPISGAEKNLPLYADGSHNLAQYSVIPWCVRSDSNTYTGYITRAYGDANYGGGGGGCISTCVASGDVDINMNNNALLFGSATSVTLSAAIGTSLFIGVDHGSESINLRTSDATILYTDVAAGKTTIGYNSTHAVFGPDGVTISTPPMGTIYLNASTNTIGGSTTNLNAATIISINIPVYADDAAAIGDGLATGTWYQTTTAGSTYLKIVPAH